MSISNEPAFPTTETVISTVGTEYLQYLPGLTKREYFAAMAMQGFCVQAIPGVHNSDDPVWNGIRVKQAVNMADALIAELEKTDEHI